MSHDRTDGPDPEDDDVGQTHRWSISVIDVVTDEADEGGCYAAVLCWPCFWNYQPDMWINKSIYESAKPVILFEKLPKLDHKEKDCWNPLKYSWPG
jgi:hypothetical protein